MKKHQSPLVHVSPNKRQRLSADERHLRKQQKQQQQGDSPSVGCWMDYESIESTQYFPSSTTHHHHSSKTFPCTINTQVASSTTTEIFLNRLHKEIVLPFRFTLSSQIQLLDRDKSVHDATERRYAIQKRILFGYNNVSKLLFDSNIGKTTKPSLIVVVNPDNVVRNDAQQQQQLQQPSSTSTIGAAMFQHIPLLSFQMNVPFLLLPSSYRSENQSRGASEMTTIHTIAAIFGCGQQHSNYDMKTFSCIAFTQQDQSRRLCSSDTAVWKGISNDKLVEQTQEQHIRHIQNTIDSFVGYIIEKVPKLGD